MGTIKPIEVKKQIYIRFRYNNEEYNRPIGLRCTGDGLKTCTCKSCIKARKQLSVIEYEIENGTLDLQKWFPKQEKKAVREQVSMPVDMIYSFDHLATRWLELANMEYGTRKSCEYHIRRLSKYFKSMDVRNIRHSDVLEFAKKLNVDGLSIKTIKNIICTLSLMFKSLVKDKVITDNPASELNLKERAKYEDEIEDESNILEQVFTAEEVLKILEYIKEKHPSMVLFFATGFYTGMRTGELLALTWDDIDFENRRIKVSKTRTACKLKGGTKTSRNRYVPIEDELLKYIKEHEKYICINGHFVTSKKDLFLNKKNTPHKSYNSIVRIWKPALEALNIPYRTPYYMRHTFACLMIDNGTQLKIVANILGHVDLTMIMKVYGNKEIPTEENNNYLNLKNKEKNNAN